MFWHKRKSSNGDYNLVSTITISEVKGEIEIKYEGSVFKLYFNSIVRPEAFESRILAQKYVENVLDKTK